MIACVIINVILNGFSVISSFVGFGRAAWGAPAQAQNTSVCVKVAKAAKTVFSIPFKIRDAITYPFARVAGMGVSGLMEGKYNSLAKDLTEATINQVTSAPVVGQAADAVVKGSRIVALGGAAASLTGFCAKWVGSGIQSIAESGVSTAQSMSNSGWLSHVVSYPVAGLSHVVNGVGAAIRVPAQLVERVGNAVVRVYISNQLQYTLFLPMIRKVGLEAATKGMQMFVMNNLFGYAVLRYADVRVSSLMNAAFSTAGLGNQLALAAQVGLVLYAYGPCISNAAKAAKAYYTRSSQVEQLQQNLQGVNLGISAAYRGPALALGLEALALPLSIITASGEQYVQLAVDASALIGHVQQE